MIIGQGQGQGQNPRNATIQGMRGIVTLASLSEQEKKRLHQKLKEAEREIQLYNTEPRNRAERRAKGNKKKHLNN
ncbi:hypothetical protein [Enterococcus phage TJE1]|uniref:Uncharacterized protein n=1 Tax=Enterococcus phage TJE1 TaxID=2951262 RepID=A0A976XPP7_9CAUD|nr:hypothetical protein [Enterococcus phage TJE1]